MTLRTGVALVAVAGLVLGDGAVEPVLAIHQPADAPLAIAPEDVQSYWKAGEEVVVIDLRPAAAFRAGHLPRARSIPLGELKRREAEIPRAGRVVLHAATPEEAAAAYRSLREAGYRNVMVLAGGLAAWTRLGYPVEVAQ